MSNRAFAIVILLVAAASGPEAQSSAPQYRTIEQSDGSRLERELNAAGASGYALVAVGNYRFVLRRDEATTHEYKVVATHRESTLLKELNHAGSQGFRVLPQGVMKAAGEWLLILERQGGGTTYAYQSVKGDDNTDAHVRAARRGGATPVAVLGQAPSQFALAMGGNPAPLLVLEMGGSAAADDRRYQVVSTKLTGTLERELNRAGAEGYAPIGSAFMTVVLERAEAETRPLEYRVISTTRASTAERELNNLATRGFCLTALPEAAKEWLFVLSRDSGATTQRCSFLLASIEPKAVNSSMALTAGSLARLVGIIEDVGVFEFRLEKSSTVG